MEIVCETTVYCPYCGEPITMMVDTLQGDYSTIEDCTVCCRPIAFEISCEPGEILGIETSPG